MSTTLYRLLSATAAGLLFGMGLAYSEMINPEVVLSFLDLAGDWNPALAFVMIGALCLTLPGFRLLKKLHKPVLALDFSLPTKRDVDGRLISGAIVFGIGWGLVGLCPGPALSGLATLQGDVLIFVLAMIAGFLAWQWLLEPLLDKTHGA